jgi:hypothetical protein
VKRVWFPVAPHASITRGLSVFRVMSPCSQGGGSFPLVSPTESTSTLPTVDVTGSGGSALRARVHA